VLGADGVQMGTRFVASVEASSHQNFKDHIIASQEGDTILTLKELVPVRMMKNKFFEDIRTLYAQNPSKEDLKNLLGRARAKKGMFEGDLEEGALEIGQISGLIKDIQPAAAIVKKIMAEFDEARDQVGQIAF